MIKNILKKSATVLIASIISLAGMLFIGSCTVGLGDAVDVDAPTVEISYPSKNATVRESFIAAGKCEDDLSLAYVEVTVTNTSTKKEFGPYIATLSEDLKSWSVELNKKAEGTFDAFNAYTQWEFPDGNYIISAVAYDKSLKGSQEAALPISIDNTAPVLLVSKPLAVGVEKASVYGRNLNIIGDISEEHDTTKLTLYYKEYDETTNSFIDSTVRSLEITGFGTMSSDNPLSIAKFDETSTEAATSILTQNYRSIYGQNVDITNSNKKNFYCGFLLEDSARIYRNPGDSGAEPGNRTSQYYILSDDYNESLFSDTTYSLNARNLMLLLNGKSSYSKQDITAITNILKETGNSASSTELKADNSSKFSIDPKNNPVWAITNFGLTNGTFKGYDLGSAVPLVLKVGGDGISINKNTIEIRLYHLGNGETPEEINSNTPYVTLIHSGEYQEGLLKERVNQPDSALEFTPTDIGIKINHFYEFRISGADDSGISIENENGIRFGFKRNSTYGDPRISFVSDSESFTENTFKSGTTLDSDTDGGITIKGKITTGHKDVEIDNSSKISISGISITDTSDSTRTVSASDTDALAEVKYQYDFTRFEQTFAGDEDNGRIYEFTVRITKKNSESSLVPETESAYKYKIGFVAEDSLGSKNEPVEFEFKVDNKAPEVPLTGITVTPTVTRTDSEGNPIAKVNGNIKVTGTVSDVGSGFKKLFWGIDDNTPVELTNASSPWTISSINTVPLSDNQTHKLKFVTEDNVGNQRTQLYDLNVEQETDRPDIQFANDSIIFTQKNNKLVGTVTDDDELASVTATYKKVSPAPADTTETSISAGTLSSGTSSHALSINLPAAEGEYNITVTAVDVPHLAKGTNTRTITVKKDNGAPEFKIVTPNSNAQTYYKNSVTVIGTVKDGSGIAYIEREIFKIENDSERKIGETVSLIPSDEDDSILVPATGDPESAGTVAEILAEKEWKNTVNFSESGTYKIVYTAKDKYAASYEGHETTKNVTFSIDNDNPEIESVKLNGNEITGWYNTNSGNFSITTSDGQTGSGVASVAYTKTNPQGNSNPGWVNMSGSGNLWESFIAFEDNSTEKHLYLKATDKAGNESAVTDITLNIDVNPPVVTVAGLSGNKYVNRQNGIEITGTFFDGTTESGTASLTFKIGDTELSAPAITINQNGNNYTAIINKDAVDSGALKITGTDNAGNRKEITPCTFIVDEQAPEINDINLTMSSNAPVYKKAAEATGASDTYYICRAAGAANTATLTITGTATDDNLFDKIELSISGHSEYDDDSEASSWSFNGLDFSSWSDSDTAVVILTAYDKAGNSKVHSFDIKFDEAAPELKKDEVTEDSYTFRGTEVKKYNSLMLGGGRYSPQTYGKLTAIDFSTYFEESGSGLSKLEYKLYGADKTEATTASLIAAFDTPGNWTSSGSFNIADTNPDNDYDVKATASISGFKPTTGTKTNYLLLRPTDNCGNKGDIEVLSIHVDQTSPTVVAASTEKLTNGTAAIVLSGSVYDVDSGLQAIRVKINGNTVIETRGENIVTNDYGTLTYTGYVPADPTVENPILDSSTTYTLGNAPSYATWTLTLTPSAGSWFGNLPELPVVAIEAEDWAVHNNEGNIAPNPTKVAVLKIDTTAPEVSALSPANGSEINGENTITGATTDTGSVPVKVSLYYAPVTSAAAPAPVSLSDYTRLKTITTEAAPASPEENTTYNQNISQIYSFSFTEDFYNSRFISATEKEKDVWILVVATDEAGNTSEIVPVKYKINRDKDRPVISFTDIDLSGATEANPKLLKEKKVYISISDDDGIVNSAQFRTVRQNTPSEWTTITLNSGSGSFLLDDDGKQDIEFKVVDSTGKVFTTTAENTWDRVYVTDAASEPNTFDAAIPVILDTLSPEVTLTEISTVSQGTPSEWVASAAFNTVLGGVTQSIQLKLTATDTGSGVDEQTVRAVVKLGDSEISSSPFQATKVSGDIYTVTIPCSTGTGVLNVKLIAEDKADREGSTEKQFDQDNTAPEIHLDSPASDKEQSGTITAVGYVTESVRLSYAISPIAASPDTYTSATAFSYMKKDSSTEETATVNLPAKDKSNADIDPSEALASLCAYKNYSANEAEKVFTYNIYFDGRAETDGPNHTSILNTWLKNMGITTEEDLISTTNPFDDLVKVYLHLKAVDSAGNVKEDSYPIWIDPQGDRPKVHFSYPSSDNQTLGGSINIIGSVEGKTSRYDVYMQIDQNDDGSWDNTDKAALEGYGYSLEAIPGLSGNYGIKIPVNGTVWSKKINESGEFNPTEGLTRKIKIRLYAVDSENRISSAKTRTISVDNDIPVINQDIQLVQWESGYSADNGFDLNDGVIQLNADGSIKFVSGAVKAKRSYSEGMYIAGEWYVISYVTDRSGISEVRIGGANGTLLSQTITANGSKIIPYIVTNGNGDEITNYAFCFPIGLSTANAVGTSEINFYAKDIGEGEKAKPVNKVFKLNYDNKAPEVTALSNGLKILNNNGYYAFGSESFERSENNANQSGIDRIAFYFTRNVTGQPETVLNPLIRQGKAGNQMNVSEFTDGPEGLIWKNVTVSAVNGSVITVASVPVFAHKGGIVKINGTIYKINNIDGTNITLSENPGATNEVLFTVAGVIDSVAPEDIPNDAEKILTDYGYGYPVSSHDDGDLIPESCVKSGTKCTWEANINSKNMSDGKVTLHYIVFDKAGNFTSLTSDGIVQNNSPRLAGAVLGTDENGNGTVDESEFYSYHQIYAGGYNGLKKITELTLPETSTNAAPVSVLKIKRKTVIKPEIVGGNGTIGYTYKVSKRNNANDGWADPYKTPVTSANIVELGTGTEDSDDVVALPEDGGIIITTDDILESGITDGQFQKFEFTIWDSTPGLTYGEDSQSAVLNVIMDVALNDTTPAMNKIIPFYWKSAKENSLKENSTENGHIDLSKDLPAAITSKTPKVSGAIKLEGIAQDNSLLKSLYVTVKGSSYQNEYKIADYADGNWTTYNSTGWDAEIRQATYAEFKAAGFITSNPSGKKDKDSVAYASQNYGHVVHWTMNIDTEAMNITAEEGIEISVSALDKGTPYTADGVTVNTSGAGGSVVYTSKAFRFNGEAGATLAAVAQTGGDDGAAAYTCKYNIDVVPYITRIKTKLSEKSKKDDTSEYDRTALGHYPVASTETVKMHGFNLAGTSSSIIKFTSNDGNAAEANYAAAGFTIPGNAKSGNVSIVVDGVESYNNRNNNDAQGSSTVTKPAESTYGDEDAYDTFTGYFYNHTPNEVNNYTLTDDVVFDIWQLNSDAARPNAAGRIDEPILKINPYNGIIGFSFLSGPMRYAMPKGNTVSYNGDMQGQKDGDYHACNGFAYDSTGWSYGFEVGGTEGNPYYFHVVDSSGNENKWTIDAAKEGNQNLRYKLKSPSIAATVHESGDTVTRNVYMAYYNSYNDQIRFRSGTVAADRTMSGLLAYDDGANTTTYNSQVIACSSTTGYNNGGDASVTAAPLGGASEYVCLDVTSDENGNDVVVIVWYDSSDSSLKFAYNTSPTSSAWRSSSYTQANRGLNRRYWSNATTIFSGAGKYCQIKVDGNKGIHIAGYDSTYGDLRYAYLPSYSDADDYDEDTDSFIVDSFQTTGLHIMMDVALDESDNPVPYISYMGSDIPKLAYSSTPRSNGTTSDMFTGKWEVTYIPTDRDVINLDAKELSQIDSRVNVGIWKDDDGKITDSSTGTSSATAGSGTCWGNGTQNPVVGYSIAHDTANDRIETAQKK